MKRARGWTSSHFLKMRNQKKKQHKQPKSPGWPLQETGLRNCSFSGSMGEPHCFSYCFHCSDRMSGTSNLQKEELALAHNVRGKSIMAGKVWWQEVAGHTGLTIRKQRVRANWGWAIQPQGLLPVIPFIQQGSTSWRFQPFNRAASWGPNFQTFSESMEDI